MLTHTTMPSLFPDEHLVVYKTPGCNVPTVACVCRTLPQAIIEADRLNVEQQAREKAVTAERLLLDRNAMSNDLGGVR